MTRKYYAKINSNNEVINVLVGDETFLDTFVDDSPGKWLECCKRTHAGVYFDPETQRPAADQSKAFRKNFPRIGDTYDASRDAFVFKQPYPSWVFNEFTCDWDPPIDRPGPASDTTKYVWNEEAYQANNTQGWDTITFD
tara:strand:- start:698 stop:1114 length:417 start_codon:yes stop_codon:yes gene_type:complete